MILVNGRHLIIFWKRIQVPFQWIWTHYPHLLLCVFMGEGIQFGQDVLHNFIFIFFIFIVYGFPIQMEAYIMLLCLWSYYILYLCLETQMHQRQNPQRHLDLVKLWLTTATTPIQRASLHFVVQVQFVVIWIVLIVPLPQQQTSYIIFSYFGRHTP